MAPRALGALFALVAALCFTMALAAAVAPKLVPGWWDGHPTVEAKVFERKDIHVGLLGAYGCNLGETVQCTELSTGGSLDVIGIAELAALGLITITAFLLMRSAWKVGDHRKLLGKLVLIEVALVSAGGAVILALGPDIKANQHVEVPIGLGMMVFWGGVASAGLASVLALRIEPEPLRLKTSAMNIPRPQVTQPAYDVSELLQDRNELRPAVPSPGGNLAGPSGYLGPHQSSPPLFENAPQLRPLYDMQQAPPAPVAPVIPERGPTPVTRAAVGQQYGIPTPPPLESPTPATKPPNQIAAFSPLPPVHEVDPLAVTSPAQQPIDLHRGTGPQQPLSAPVGSQPGVIPTGSQPGVPRVTPPSRNPGASTAPPPSRATPSSTAPPMGKPSVPLPGKVKPVGRATPPQGDKPIKAPAKHPTLAYLVPPMPNATNMPAPSVLPARDSQVRLPTDADGEATAAHDPVDPITAVEIDGDAKAIAVAAEHTDKNMVVPPPPTGEQPTVSAREDSALRRTPAPSIGDVTDQLDIRAAGAAEDHNLTMERPRPSPSEVAAALERPRPGDEAVTVPARPDLATLQRAAATDNAHAAATVPARPSAEDLNVTIERPRPSASDLNATIERPRESMSEMDPTMERARESAPALTTPAMPAVPPPPAPAPAAKPADVPISTAPTSLPPPKKTTVTMSGPTPACPQCESPMAWVEEHLRFYCASCRMYF